MSSWDETQEKINQSSEYVNEQFNQNMKGFTDTLAQRYRTMNPGNDRDDDPTIVGKALNYNPVDGLMKFLGDKLDKFKLPVPGIQPIGPLHYHYGERTPISLGQVYHLATKNELIISYDVFCRIQGEPKAKATLQGQSNKYKKGAQATNAKTFPLKEVGEAWKHKEHVPTGRVVDENNPDRYTNLDPNWEWTPEIIEKNVPDFLEHVGQKPLEEVKREWDLMFDQTQIIPQEKLDKAIEKATEKIYADIEAGLYTTISQDGTLSDTILYPDGTDTGIPCLLWQSKVKDGTIDPWKMIGEAPPYESLVERIPGTEAPKIFDPATGGTIEFNPESFNEDQYLSDLEDYYWKDLIAEADLAEQNQETSADASGETSGYEVAWTGEVESPGTTSRNLFYKESSGTGAAPPGSKDVDYYLQSTENPPPHPQELIDPNDVSKIKEIVDRYDQDLDTSTLAPDVELYIGFQRASNLYEKQLKEKHAMLALPISNIQVRWPEKDKGEVTITFKKGIALEEWRGKLLDDKEYHGNKAQPDRTLADSPGWYKNDIICIAQYYDPDDPSSYDSVKMITDEINREFHQSMRQQGQNIRSTARQCANILIDSVSDKQAMCCLFISFLNANPDLKEKLDWDEYSVTGDFCIDTRDDDPKFMLNEEKCNERIEDGKPYVWETRTFSVQDLLNRKRDELIAIRTILEIAMEGFVSWAVELKALMLNIMEILMTIIHMSLATWLNLVTKHLIDHLRAQIQKYKQEVMDQARDGHNRFVAALWRCLPLERILMMLIEALIGPPGLIGAVKDYSARLLAKFKRFAATSNAELMSLRAKQENGPMYPYLKGAVEIINWLLDLTAQGLMVCGAYNFEDQVIYSDDNTATEEGSELIWCELPSGSFMWTTQEDCDLMNGDVVEEEDVIEENVVTASGCTDPLAVNYNPDAVYDDGTCIMDSNTGDPETDLIACQMPDGTIEMMSPNACEEAGGEVIDQSNQQWQDFTNPLDPSYYDTSPYTGQIDITDTEIDPLKLLIGADEAEMAKFFNKYIGISREDARRAAADAAAGRCVDLLSQEQVNNMKAVLNTAGVPDNGE